MSAIFMFHLFKIKFIKQVTEWTIFMFIKDARKFMKMLWDFFLIGLLLSFGRISKTLTLVPSNSWLLILDHWHIIINLFYFEYKKEICMIGILSKRAWIATKPQNHFKLPKKTRRAKVSFIHTKRCYFMTTKRQPHIFFIIYSPAQITNTSY